MSELKKNSIYMLAGQMAVVFFQGVQFLLVARALGPLEFGRVAGVLAIAAVLLPFSGLGSGNVMVLRLARNEGDVRTYFGNAIFVAAVSGIVLTIISILFGVSFLSSFATYELLLIFSVSEIILTKLIDIAVHVFYGLEKHIYSSFFYAAHSASRMLFSLPLLYINSPNAEQWAWLHLLAGLTALALVFAMTIRQIGIPKLDVSLAFHELREGLPFSVGLASKSIYTDIDKAVLAKYSSPEIGGAYTAAFRLIFIAYAPIRAVLQASMARLFREGELGIFAPVKFATRIVIWGSVYSIVFAVLIYIAAPLITYLLGDAYFLSVNILQSMALVPLILVLQDAYSDALMGAGRQTLRSVFQVSVAVICFAMNMYLIPIHSWKGAVFSTYFSQAFLALLIIGSIWILIHRLKNLADVSAPQH